MLTAFFRAFLLIVALIGFTAHAQSNMMFDTSIVKPRFRVIIDNDFSGDPDGLFELVHHLLSPSVDVRAVIGSHLAPGDPFDPSSQQATNAYRRALEVLRLMGLTGRIQAYPGANA